MLRPVLDPVLTREIIARYTGFASSVGAPAPMELLASAPAVDVPQSHCENYIQNLYQITRVLQENILVNLQLDFRFLALHLSNALEQAERAGARRVRMLDRHVEIDFDKTGKLQSATEKQPVLKGVGPVSVVHLARSAAHMPLSPVEFPALTADFQQKSPEKEHSRARNDLSVNTTVSDSLVLKSEKELPVSMQHVPVERTLKEENPELSQKGFTQQSGLLKKEKSDSKSIGQSTRSVPLGHVDQDEPQDGPVLEPRPARLEWEHVRSTFRSAERQLWTQATLLEKSRKLQTALAQTTVGEKRMISDGSKSNGSDFESPQKRGNPRGTVENTKGILYPPETKIGGHMHANAEKSIATVPEQQVVQGMQKPMAEQAFVKNLSAPELTHPKTEKVKENTGRNPRLEKISSAQWSQRDTTIPQTKQSLATAVTMTHREETTKPKGSNPNEPAVFTQALQKGQVSAKFENRKDSKASFEQAELPGRNVTIPAQLSQQPQFMQSEVPAAMTHLQKTMEQGDSLLGPAGDGRVQYSKTNMLVSSQQVAEKQSTVVSISPQTLVQPSKESRSVRSLFAFSEKAGSALSPKSRFEHRMLNSLAVPHARINPSSLSTTETMTTSSQRLYSALSAKEKNLFSNEAVSNFVHPTQQNNAEQKVASLADSPAVMELRKNPVAAASQSQQEVNEIPTVHRTRTTHKKIVEKEEASPSHPTENQMHRTVERIPLSEVERIADKVYRQIESRLRSEKMRRGM
ncbi:hypothetical protein [uncultured Ruthenibacterium sp.]|uniref:hypothetical protein n=1 Tax=uncultured Ruthenibacterium sp. TaxID=1905347 RepID=UPI00349E7E7B